jgi:hypothetical protein
MGAYKQTNTRERIHDHLALKEGGQGMTESKLSVMPYYFPHAGSGNGRMCASGRLARSNDFVRIAVIHAYFAASIVQHTSVGNGIRFGILRSEAP